MKTAISVPDPTFARVEVTAAALGMSRSEFYSRAAERYLDELDDHSIIAQINAVVDAVGAADDSNAVAAQHGRRRLAAVSDEW